MSAMITVCPNLLKCVLMSTDAKPVTQTAEVEVNSASMKETGAAAQLMGSHSKTAPTKMAPLNP